MTKPALPGIPPSLSSPISPISPSALTSFTTSLLSSTRILALCGAGLSASSGLATFRGAGGLWRTHAATSLATPEAFERDPGLVWSFYAERRRAAAAARPNPAHHALAELARRRSGFVCLTQNVDGLSQRANHPPDQLHLLHGSLFDIKCTRCSYTQFNNFTEPIHPSLAVSLSPSSSSPSSSSSSPPVPPAPPPTTIPRSSLPSCPVPSCHDGLLRPGVVWFGEALPAPVLSSIEAWIALGPIDLMLVIGTTAHVWPAAEYIEIARARGARVAVVNADASDLGAAQGLRDQDWLFVGDAALLVPLMLRAVVGDVEGLEA